MRTVYGFDDDEVVTGDGLISVDSDIEGVEKVTGSRSFVRDPRLTAPGYGRGTSRPDYGHVPRIPTDENGKPMRFCSGGHYAPHKKFGKRERNLFHGERDGLDDTCLDCRKLQRRRHTSGLAS